MRATIDYIEQHVAEYNQLYFDGSLPPITIRLSNAKGFLGKVCFKRIRGCNTDFVLRINTRIDLPEEVVQDTILHELIHYYIACHNLSDTSTHGALFRQHMARINQAGGRQISISHRLTQEQQQDAAGAARQRVVCVVYFKDGQTGVKVVPRQMRHILHFHRTAGLHFPIERMEWYTTKDGYFAKYPSSSAMKIYLVDKQDAIPFANMQRLYLSCLCS